MTDRLFAVIPCAGIGARAGASLPKQYRTVAGRNLLHHTLGAFDGCSELAQTLVVLAPDDQHFDPRRFGGLRFAVRRCGGATRQASVANGLAALTEFGARANDWVLVHDAARPGITTAMIRALIAAVRDDPIGGILALPLADTLKREVASGTPAGARASTAPGSAATEAAASAAAAAGARTAPARIGRTEKREGLWLAQTPQMFRLHVLRDALRAAQEGRRAVTDEASAVEMLGYQPLLVHGHPANFKVTWPEDFELAEAMLSAAARKN